MHKQEGFASYKGFKIYYVVYGKECGETPLLALHGGPGYPHYHLENLADITKTGRQLVLYDQLGCGQSERPDDPNLWTIRLFLEEIDVIRNHLKLANIHLLGHSWGGALAAEYALTNPKGLDRLILSSPLLDSHLWVAEAKKLIDTLPQWAADLMHQHEKAGTTDSYEYQEAYQEFKNRFICRAKPYPDALIRSDQEMSAQVYNTMWGPSETTVNGRLKDWSVLERLHNIHAPTLFISGKYDEATPKQIELAQKNIPRSKWALLDNSSHSGNFEEHNRYIQAVQDFLD